MASLSYQLDRRGIDAVLAQLETGQALSRRGRGRHIHRQLGRLQAVLEAEAANLRGLDGATSGLFLQQVALRAGRLGEDDLAADAQARLNSQRYPWLRLRWRSWP